MYCRPQWRFGWPLPPMQLTTPLVYDESLSVPVQIGHIFAILKKFCERLGECATKEALESLYNWIVTDQYKQDCEMRDYTDDEILALRKWVQWQLDRIKAGELAVVNPTSGQKDTVQDSFDDLYEWLRYFAMTSLVFDVQGYTAQELDAFSLTAREYDTGDHEYMKRRRHWRAYSNVTGRYGDPQDVFLSFQQKLSDPWSAGGFDARAETAAALDGNGWTAEYYDWTNYYVAEPYELPVASPTALGAVKVGANLTVEADGTLNAIASGGGGGSYTAGTGLGLAGTQFFLKEAGTNALGGTVFATDEDFKAYMGMV